MVTRIVQTALREAQTRENMAVMAQGERVAD
jgi:hypothetical protein